MFSVHGWLFEQLREFLSISSVIIRLFAFDVSNFLDLKCCTGLSSSTDEDC
jgi:hypothetical protein